jgi:stearoyl-CoA desaturase (delta-9 desaturase)
MIKRHPDCEEKRSKIDVKYLWSDPIVKFQYDYYIPLVLLINVMIPTFIPYFLFGETVTNGFFICFVFRYVYTMELALSGESILLNLY